MVRSTLLAALLLLCSGCLSPEEAGALLPPTADEDPRLPQVELTVAGQTRAVHLESFGDPTLPLLLVLHGSLADFRALRPFSALAERYHVVLWDQRGNGLSERITAAEYTWDSVVEEIDAVRERFAPGLPAALLGHSFGAMYATLYASRHPDRVSELVLLEPGGLNGRIFQETYSTIINVDLLDPGMNAMFWQNELLTPSTHERADYRALMILLNGHQTNYFCDPEHPTPLPVWRPGAYVEYLRGARMGTGGGFGTPHFDFDFAAGMRDFPHPVLIVAGSCSALGPDFQTRHHVPLFASAEVVRVEGAGHRLFVERFDEVLRAVTGHLVEYR